MEKYYRVRGVTELPSMEIMKIEYGGYHKSSSKVKRKVRTEIKKKYGVTCDIIVLEEVKEKYLINKIPGYVKSTSVDTGKIKYDVYMLNNLLEDSKKKLESSRGSDKEEFYLKEVIKYTNQLKIEIAAWEYLARRVPEED